MLRILKTTALSAMIAAGALSAVTAGAQAEGLYLNFGDGGARAGFHVGDDYGDGFRRRDGWREQGWRRGCSPERALDKADRMGLHRVRIVDVDRRTITVAGRQYGDRVTVTFGRGPHCPVLDY
jgi:hypothetical protein